MLSIVAIYMDPEEIISIKGLVHQLSLPGHCLLASFIAKAVVKPNVNKQNSSRQPCLVQLGLAPSINDRHFVQLSPL